MHPVERDAGDVRQHRLAGAPVGKILVVAAGRGPVGRLAERDLQRVVRAHAALGEDASGHLKQGEIEGRFEIAGQVRLHERRADSPEIIAQTDADARLLTRLRGRVAGLLERRGDGRAIDGAMRGCGGSGVRIAAVGSAGCLLVLGQVLGLDEAVDDLKRTVVRDRGDAAGDREILAAEPGAALHRRLDRLKALHDGASLGFEFLVPFVVVEVRELVVAHPQLLKLFGLLVRGLAGLRVHPPIAGGDVPVDLGESVGPLPPGAEFVGRGREPVHGQLVQQVRILQPDAVLVLVGEKVPQHRAAGRLVRVNADEAREGGVGRDALLGQQALDLVDRPAVLLGGELLPHGALAFMVRRDRERLERLKADFPGAVGVEDLGGGVAEAQALLDEVLGNTEARGDGGDGGAGLGEFGEGGHLVGGVHGDAHDVLRERQFAGVVVRSDPAKHGVIGVERAFLGQRVQRCEAPSAGHDGEALIALVVGAVGAGDEVLQKTVGADGGRELVLGGFVRRGLAHILGRKREIRKGDLAEGGIGRGCGAAHAVLHG